MPILRLQCTFGADSALPRDRMVITPHFSVGFDLGDPTSGTDADALCEDLATGLSGWMSPANGREVTVKAYDAQGTPPVAPIGEAIRQPQNYPASTVVREIALCLSYFAGFNRPGRRGRLYLPLPVIGGGTTVGARPTQAHRDLLAQLPPILTGLGGTNVDWVVYSRRDDAAHSVTNWWIDDEWDVQRRRGLRSTLRTTGTTSEAGLP